MNNKNLKSIAENITEDTAIELLKIKGKSLINATLSFRKWGR